jgi:hypothetical protein
VIPLGVSLIGEHALKSCAGLRFLEIPSSTTTIDSGAFLGCVNLAQVIIHDGVVSIGASAFVGCANLTTLTIPKSVERIGIGAFHRCDGLTQLSIPLSVRLNHHAFHGVLLTRLELTGAIPAGGVRPGFVENLQSSLREDARVVSVHLAGFLFGTRTSSAIRIVAA